MSKLNKPKERGSSDELEIMREIIKNDPLLLERVLTKIREVRNGGRNLADVVAEKKGAKREEERRRGSGT
ncbi:hypothetical protein [Oligoflexus tunisiensis]|uniref:hypothetical protein n=1 Tax=Oligoflexus tunisiensis TaxID=708132 RepID=UPI00114CC84B|nr:hypothetical protein [Oligoflexus tunisiensis]